MSKAVCLIVDDEPDLLDLIEITLDKMDIACHKANNVTQAKKLLLKHHVDLCLTDMKLPDGDGIELVEYIQAYYPAVPVAVITAYGNVETAVKALKTGAFDFIAKPVKLDELRNLVENTLRLPKPVGSETRLFETVENPVELVASVEKSTPAAKSSELVEDSIKLSKSATPTELSKSVTPTAKLFKPAEEIVQSLGHRDQALSALVGKSAVMRELRDKIEKLARNQAPVYIRGESGSGKEVVARLIHQLGGRANKPFIPVNCGAIPSELMESEFFGHKRGSFSGANADKPGLFQAAHGGTLFLDEVADLTLLMQVKLLRAIQEKQIRPIGAQKEIPVDVRILSATHRNLADLVKKNKFRQDLFYRLNVIELTVPPLREHIEDVPLLVDKILKRFGSDKDNQPRLSIEALEMLKSYLFPGNVRELENILERAVALCENNIIELVDLQLPTLEEQLVCENSEDQSSDLLNEVLGDLEKETIQSALEQAKGNKTKAAKLLGITFGKLRYRMQKLRMI